MNKIVLIFRLTIVSIILIIVLIGLVGGGYFSSVKERSEMDIATASVPETAIPPIDAAAPAQTETATFALG
jgi:hypothetical protein